MVNASAMNTSARATAGMRSESFLVAEIFHAKLQEVLRAARELLSYDDPLDAELWAAELVDMWPGLLYLVDDEPERVCGQSLVRFAREHAGPEALACLTALAAVTTPPVARKARQTADELQRRGVRAPSWAAKLRQVRVVGAWTAGDPYGDQEAVLLAFAHAGMQPHTFQLLVDHNFGGMVKDGFLTDTALEQVLDEWYPSGHPSEAWVFQAIDPAEAASKVRRGLKVRDHCLDVPESKSLQDCPSSSTPGWGCSQNRRPAIPSSSTQQRGMNSYRPSSPLPRLLGYPTTAVSSACSSTTAVISVGKIRCAGVRR